jgi:hypothetical protein
MLDSGRGAMIAVIARNVKSCFEQTLTGVTLWNVFKAMPILRDVLRMSRDLLFRKVVTD